MQKDDVIKKEMNMEAVLARDPAIASILLAQGMNRIGIPLMTGKSLLDVCHEQEKDPDEITERINEFLRNKNRSDVLDEEKLRNRGEE